MSDVKTLEDKIEGKLKMLRFTIEATAQILEAKDLKAVERYSPGGIVLIRVDHMIIDKNTSTKMASSGTAEPVTTLRRSDFGPKA